jgi:hypothetical protein
VPGIGQPGGGRAEVENLIDIAAKRGELVSRCILLFHNCKIKESPFSGIPDPVICFLSRYLLQ